MSPAEKKRRRLTGERASESWRISRWVHVCEPDTVLVDLCFLHTKRTTFYFPPVWSSNNAFWCEHRSFWERPELLFWSPAKKKSGNLTVGMPQQREPFRNPICFFRIWALWPLDVPAANVLVRIPVHPEFSGTWFLDVLYQLLGIFLQVKKRFRYSCITERCPGYFVFKVQWTCFGVFPVQALKRCSDNKDLLWFHQNHC